MGKYLSMCMRLPGGYRTEDLMFCFSIYTAYHNNQKCMDNNCMRLLFKVVLELLNYKIVSELWECEIPLVINVKRKNIFCVI